MTMHRPTFTFAVGIYYTMGIKSIAATFGVPFVSIKLVKIFRVNNSVLTLREKDSSERIAIADFSV
ncbi:MAG: hypothetical protein WC496_12525 [Phycisphaerae bacterium]